MTVSLIDILKAIDEIKIYLEQGDSIQLARKKACGSQLSPLAKSLSQNERYLTMLNKYMERKKRNFRFMKTSKGLKLTSIRDYEIIKEYGRKRDRESNSELSQ